MRFLRFPLPTMGGKQVWGDEFVHAGARIQQNVLTKHHRLLTPGDRLLASGSWAECYNTFLRWRDESNAKPLSDHLVLVLHGVFRSKDSMETMKRGLVAAGYDAHTINYPSTRQSLSEHADQIERVLTRAEGATTVSLVAHSMGGMVSRVLLMRDDAQWRKQLAFNRLVTIATPHKGAEIAELLGKLPGFEQIAGQATIELFRDGMSEIPLPNVPFGTVAGARGDERGYNPLLPGDDDFTVTLDSAIVEEAEDKMIVDALHTFIMSNAEVVKGTVNYLRTGKFVRS